jgi:2-C-methyl-D-erythritol 4-phosphate cytidylyltransferase
MVFAIILAGGVGSRMKTDMPKQFIELSGRMMLMYAMDSFAESSMVDRILIVAAREWRDRIRESINSDAHSEIAGKFIGFSDPGENRQLSILNAMQDIKELCAHEGSSTDAVIIQDAARPFVTVECVNSCISNLEQHDGAMPVLPMKDTVYFSNNGKQVDRLLDRACIYAGQAPEAFRFEKYLVANESLLPDKIKKICGSTEPAIMAGMDVAMICGDQNNFKITTDEDLERARAIMDTSNSTSAKKKLLILGGAGPHEKVVNCAKEMGIYTIVADYLEDSPAKKIADEAMLCDVFDVDRLVKYGKEHKINGVINLSLDPAQRPTQMVAEALGLPTYGDAEQVKSLSDKEYFREVCIKAGVDVIPWYSENDIEDAELPVLVKPNKSRGSRGVSICYSKEDIPAAMEKAKGMSDDGKCILQKYMADNQDLTISYMVKDGKATLISLGDRNSGRAEDNLSCQLVGTVQPSRYAPEYMKDADLKIRHMIEDVLRIENGPVFLQGFWDNGKVRLYDPGIRFPGNEYELIYKKAVGLDPVKSLISYCIGEGLLDYNGGFEGSYDLNGKAALQYMINVGPGTIGEYTGLDEIAKFPFVVDVKQKHFVGEVIEDTGDIRHRAGEISILVNRNVHEMVEAIERVQATLRILDDKGNNQIISPISTDLIKRVYTGIWDD